MLGARVIAVAKDGAHRFSKKLMSEICIVEGMGVAGDAHLGETVKHRSRVATNPSAPNLRQVHLIHSELFSEVRKRGFVVGAADLGENITTTGVDLLGLPKGTILKIGQTVELEVTGLRNPCKQINEFQAGLLSAVLMKEANGNVIRKTGVMAVAKVGGLVKASDPIQLSYPMKPYFPLERV